MAFNRGITPRNSPIASGARVLLTLLTLSLFFEILRLLTLTTATPISHLTQRHDDFGLKDAFIYHPGLVDTSAESSEH